MDKKRRGLGALIPNVAWRGREEPVAQITPNQIQPNPYQPRQDLGGPGLDELVESVRVHGMMQPLLVRRHEDGYQLIAGQRRLEAARRLGLDTVPVVVRQCTERELLELALVENLQREDLNPLEAARAYQRLSTEFGLNQEELADRVGKSRPAVANTMRLLNLPKPVQEAIEQGRLSEGHGRALLSAGEPERIQALAETVERQGLSVREAEALARRPHTTKTRRPARARTVDPNLADLEARLREALGTRVAIRPHPRTAAGQIEIEYYSADDLERLAERLLGEASGE